MSISMSMIDGPGRAGRPRLSWWPALLVLLGLMACTPSAPPVTYTPPESRVTEPSGSSLYLELASLTGDTVPEAQVSLSSGQRERANTRGTLLLEKLQVGPQRLAVQAKDYYPTVLSFDMAAGVRAGARLKLLPLGAPVATFDASAGRTITTQGERSVTLDIPAGALRDVLGNPVQGQVEAFLTSLNLEGGDLVAAPGMLEGIPAPGADPVGLESLGMVALVFKKDGEIVPFARGVRIRGSVPGSIRVGSQGVPAQNALPPLPVWRSDPDTGLWVPTGQQGRFVESNTPDSLEWEITVDNPSGLLNIALPYWWRSPSASPTHPLQVPEPAWGETACLEVRVKDDQGQPVSGRMVVAQGVEYMGLSRALTDAAGLARLKVMRNQAVQVEAGEGITTVSTSIRAGDCLGQGAEPMSVTLPAVSAPTCTPGAGRDCAYNAPVGTLDQGACRASRQSCDVNGTRWSDTCEGEILPRQEDCETTLDDDCDGETNETCATLCQEGETLPCYDGPEGTENVGQCHRGTRTCAAGGTAWSETCGGQVHPEAVEDCSQPGDENCDGVACQCWPDERKRCGYTGPAGTENVGECHASFKTCNPSGTDWSACAGEVTPLPEEDCLTPGDDDCDGTADEVSVCVCVPGETSNCYEGPTGTENVGVCHGGTKTCNATRTGWNACVGQVMPQRESCANALDDDCSGMLNDAPGCVCVPGTSDDCYGGPEGTEDVGLCHGGTKTCEASGMAWSACMGQVLPLTQEDCTTPGDDDCDGTANEGPVCVCVPGAITTCPYGGPDGTAGVGVCRADTKQCNASGTDWGACSGEVTPQPENCATSADDDCDGQRNENPPCGWAVRSMPEARKQHTTVVLSNGKVLVSGGVGPSNGALRSARIYDPVTRTWTSIADMKSTRSNHAAVVLSGDKVLVSGGYGRNEGESSDARLSTAEVYDPVADTWTYVGSMASVRDYHTLTLLMSTGEVLVSGGYGASDRIALAEVYDPNGKTWTSVGAMNAARAGHTATRLSGDKVLVSGGDTANSSTPLKTAEVYDPNGKTWTFVGQMGSARARHTATLLDGDKVLVSGGFNGSSTLATAEVYDPVARAWSAVGNMNSSRKLHTAVRLSTGETLVLGGDNQGNPLATADLYDPATQAWTVLTPMSAARTEHTTVVLNTGEVLVTGGRGASAPLATTEVYNPTPATQVGAWMSVNPMAVRRHTHRATLLSDGKVLVTGGKNGGTTLKSAEVYDPSKGTWLSVGDMSSPREGHTATLLASGKVLVVGGFNGTTALNTAELYDPLARTWTTLLNNLVTPRQVHTATLLADGKVLIAGGINGPVLSANVLKKAEVYDPEDDTFTPTTNDLAVARYWHTATLLNNGTVLIAGGHLASGSTPHAEVYAAGAWSSVGALGLSRDFHTATLLNTGKVLVTGGYGDGLFRQGAELYDQGGYSWTNTGALSTARREHTATLLNDGRVLVLGGKGREGSSYDAFLSSAELYNPGGGTWSSANFLAVPVGQHTATRLNDGKVLITGGENNTGSLNTVLLYNP